ELVEKIRALGQDVLDGVKFGFNNVVDQVKVLNPTVQLITEGLSMLKRVENGHIIIPPEYAQMVEDDEEDEQEGGEKGHEMEGHDESDS
ncbi:hypothetical protein A2U01_0059371, partial [Trifolium medium]|nr:hypothetical protein [Trifolium medium]